MVEPAGLSGGSGVPAGGWLLGAGFCSRQLYLLFFRSVCYIYTLLIALFINV